MRVFFFFTSQGVSQESSTTVSVQVSVDNGGSVTSDCGVRDLARIIEVRFGSSSFIFQHDNDLKHIAGAIKGYLDRKIHNETRSTQ